MSIFFSPKKIGNVELPNRFICSATYEVMSKKTGEVSNELIKRYERLPNGQWELVLTVFSSMVPTGI